MGYGIFVCRDCNDKAYTDHMKHCRATDTSTHAELREHIADREAQIALHQAEARQWEKEAIRLRPYENAVNETLFALRQLEQITVLRRWVLTSKRLTGIRKNLEELDKHHT